MSVTPAVSGTVIKCDHYHLVIRYKIKISCIYLQWSWCGVSEAELVACVGRHAAESFTSTKPVNITDTAAETYGWTNREMRSYHKSEADSKVPNTDTQTWMGNRSTCCALNNVLREQLSS